MVLLKAPSSVLISDPRVLCSVCDSPDSSATVGVALSVFPPASCGGAPKSWHLRICCKPKTSWFAPSFPSHLNTETNTAPPCWPEGRSLGTPTAQLNRRGGALAALSEALSPILNHLPGKRGGGGAGFTAGAWRRDERGCGRESPCLQGGQGWMRFTTGMEAFAKSSLALTMWPVEGQAGEEIEVNNVVTY